MDELKTQLRKSSRYKTRSRDTARRMHKQISTGQYNGTGNVPKFVLASLPEFHGNKRMLERALNRCYDYESSAGRIPDRVTLRRMFDLG